MTRTQRLLIHLSHFLISTITFAQGEKRADWLIDGTGYIAQIIEHGNEIELTNSLLSRTINLQSNAVTTEFKNLATDETYLRTLSPEAELSINGNLFPIGGLVGLKEHGYFMKNWLEALRVDDNAFSYYGHEIGVIRAKIKWPGKKRYHTAGYKSPKGKELVLKFKHHSPALKGLEVKVHYEIYDGIPLIAKWITVQNNGKESFLITGFKNEILAYPELENHVESPDHWKRPNLHVESDYAFGGFTFEEANTTIFWESDKNYTSQVNWNLETPCKLISGLQTGPDHELLPGESFESFHTYELLLDGTDRERNALSKRKMYRILSPWITENPIFMHLTTTETKNVKRAIDQCKNTGYEMVILSFGSGLNMEDTTRANISKFKKLADYAHERGIEFGGYSLLSSRSIDPKYDIIGKDTGKPGGAKFGNAPCLATEWGKAYFEKLKFFLEKTGFDVLEHDGPYPGDFCASSTHKFHKGYGDSQWVQWNMTKEFYNWLREKDIYLNAPDFYFLQGSSKCGIGYREVNWSLPREQQLILGRQNIYDGTWEKTPSMAWTFVPLTEYHGGGTEATLEPLENHLNDYRAHMVQNYGAGIQACYRGPRLYDGEKTKSMVIEQISHYKRFRAILNSDIIHLRRPDGRDWDGFVHINANLPEKGYALFFNPTNSPIKRTLKIPLYYSGLTGIATILSATGEISTQKLNNNFEIVLDVEIPPKDMQWFIIQGNQR